MSSFTWHEGEKAAQSHLGVQERMAEIGPRVVRDHLPEQHQRFFEQLPMLLAGVADGQGRPWASMLVGPPGFIRVPDAQRLHIQALPLPGDPLAVHLHEGAPIGLLGIELATRRRNRANGHVTDLGPDGFGVQVAESVGNCPQYIHRRVLEAPAAGAGTAPTAAAAQPLQALDADALALVARADTLFVASHAPAGADVSHRGGPAGFVQVEDSRTLLVPDYAGNQMFMTLGNLLVDPRAGVLFVDFDSGDLLSLTGHAEVLWSGPAVQALPGAQRACRFHLQAGWRLPRALPWRRAATRPTAERRRPAAPRPPCR